MNLKIKFSLLLVAACIALLGFDCADKSGPTSAGISDDDDDSAPPQTTETVFSGKRAYDYALDQLAFGPRVPGTDAAADCAVYLHDTLLNFGWIASFDEFDSEQFPGVHFRNIYARLEDKAPRLLLVAHYDSRPIAERDPDVTVRGQPIPGANDGASGVAVLLELADLLKKKPPGYNVGILFTDGEDYTHSFGAPLLGAKHFAELLSQSEADGIGALILLDMVGDSGGVYPYEPNSNRTLYDIIAGRAKSFGFEAISGAGGGIYDDHVPFAEKGVPVVDIIQYPFPSYWHTTGDDAGVLSVDRLGQIGETVLRTVYYFDQKGFGELNR